MSRIRNHVLVNDFSGSFHLLLSRVQSNSAYKILRQQCCNSFLVLRGKQHCPASSSFSSSYFSCMYAYYWGQTQGLIFVLFFPLFCRSPRSFFLPAQTQEAHAKNRKASITPTRSTSFKHKKKTEIILLPASSTMVVQRMMVCCAKMNNEGAVHLGNGRYEDAAQSFTAALQLVKSSITTLNGQEGDATMKTSGYPTVTSPSPSQVVISPLYDLVQQADCSLDKMFFQSTSSSSSSFFSSPLALYRSPLRISDVANFEHNDPTVEASVAVIFNLALTYHLKGLYMIRDGVHGDCHRRQLDGFEPPINSNSNGPDVAMYQAATLYELAYSIVQQEQIDIHAEFSMAMINNLGHAYRTRGDADRSDECFRYLLSTHMFLQSYGRTDRMRTIEFIASISHLILKESTAPAAWSIGWHDTM